MMSVFWTIFFRSSPMTMSCLVVVKCLMAVMTVGSLIREKVVWLRMQAVKQTWSRMHMVQNTWSRLQMVKTIGPKTEGEVDEAKNKRFEETHKRFTCGEGVAMRWGKAHASPQLLLCA